MNVSHTVDGVGRHLVVCKGDGWRCEVTWVAAGLCSAKWSGQEVGATSVEQVGHFMGYVDAHLIDSGVDDVAIGQAVVQWWRDMGAGLVLKE